MQLTKNVYLGLVMAGSSKGEVFLQEKLNAWTGRGLAGTGGSGFRS